MIANRTPDDPRTRLTLREPGSILAEPWVTLQNRVRKAWWHTYPANRAAVGEKFGLAATYSLHFEGRMLTVTPTAITAVKLIVPKSFGDNRGSFCEVYNRNQFHEHGIMQDFVQDNQSWSALKGTVRGLHFQRPPMAQDKLVWVPYGRIFDVAVDLRRSSPTFGRWVTEELSAENGRQLLIPAGFAHGFCTLEPNTYVFYKVTNYYSPQDDFGIAWNDPDLGIDWPIDPTEAVVSDKDARLPPFKSLPSYFE